MIGRRGFLMAVAGALVADAPITPKRKIALFNGKNLKGLYTWLKTTKFEDPNKVFTVQNRMLRICGEDWGGIGTRQDYRDYHLIVEWKWGGQTFGARKQKARDSGILVHAVGADGAYSGVWPESIECQVIEGGCGDFILVNGANRPRMTVECRLGKDGQHYWQKGGEPVTKDRGRFNWFGRDIEWKDTLGFRGRQEVENPTGEWNRSEVICRGDSVTAMVNGVVVNHGTKASHTAGRIMIQAEGAEVLIRRWELGPVARTVAITL